MVPNPQSFVPTQTLSTSIVFATVALIGCSSTSHSDGRDAVRAEELNAVRLANARAADAAQQAAFEADPVVSAWVAAASVGELPQLRLYLSDDEYLEFIYVGPGACSAISASGVQGDINISRGFRMTRTELTQRQWRLLTGSTPSRFIGDDLRPVERVSYNDATTACERLSARFGATVRLPSVAEWTYAARAGSNGDWCFGNDPTQLERFAWFDGNSSDSTRPVGLKQPNAWGLCDMHGNVREWCSDAFSKGGESARGVPSETTASNAPRVLCGGDFDSSADGVRCSARAGSAPEERFALYGVRLCIDLRPRSAPEAAEWASVLTEREAAKTRVRDAFWKKYGVPPVPSLTIDRGDGTPMDFIYVKPGSLRMGSPTTEAGHEGNEQAVDVTVRRPFWMARTEVTQAQWRAVVGTNPSRFSDGPDAGRQPVESVRWIEAREFCERVATKFAPMRLPSEAEWEFACRAGSTTAYGFDNDPQQLERFAWFGGDTADTTYQVATKQPNA